MGALPDTLEAPEEFDEEHRLRFAFSAEMARAEGGALWPNSYLPYYLYPHAFVQQARRVGPRSDAVTASLPRYYEHFAEQAGLAEPQLRFFRGGGGFGDMAATVIGALCAEHPVELVLNLPNRGATSQFADDTVIETQVRVSRHGIERLTAPELPASFCTLAIRLEKYQRLAARAATGAREVPLAAALAANPMVGNAELAGRLLMAARSAYGELIAWPS